MMRCKREPIRFMAKNDVMGISVMYALIFSQEYPYVLNYGYYVSSE